MKRILIWLVACAVFTILLSNTSACTQDSRSELKPKDSAAGGSGGGLGVGGGLSSTGGGLPPAVIGTMTGTVLAPEGTIPISGALVYLTSAPPEAIPQQVFCDKCIELGTDIPFTLSAPDGTFTVDAFQPGDQFLVVQKGAFRRVRTVNVVEGDQMIGTEFTTLPAVQDPANGDDVPKMAVLDGIYDDIENTLGKLGLGQVDGNGDLVSTQSFDFIQGGARTAFLTDYATISQYHIVYIPCADSWPDSYLSDPQVLDNLRKFIAAGGRLYVTDWSYDVLRQMEPTPISWVNDGGGYGDAHLLPSYDADATATDQGLADWLGAQGINNFVAELNYTAIQSVNPYTAPNEDGTSDNFTPTVWVTGDYEGAPHPLTTSYQYGCGRALFSTYHTEAGPTLLAQERALLYILLEVAVCIGEIGPPQ